MASANSRGQCTLEVILTLGLMFGLFWIAFVEFEGATRHKVQKSQHSRRQP